MDEKIAEEKLRKNSQRVTGVAALRKIRNLVDNFEAQGNRNKKRSIALLVITLLIFLLFIYYILNHKSSLKNIKTSQAEAVIVYSKYNDFLTGSFVTLGKRRL